MTLSMYQVLCPGLQKPRLQRQALGCFRVLAIAYDHGNARVLIE
jgi:hypothetical protein